MALYLYMNVYRYTVNTCINYYAVFLEWKNIIGLIAIKTVHRWTACSICMIERLLLLLLDIIRYRCSRCRDFRRFSRLQCLGVNEPAGTGPRHRCSPPRRQKSPLINNRRNTKYYIRSSNVYTTCILFYLTNGF